MKLCLFLLLLMPVGLAHAQQTVPLPHGMIFGTKPDTANAMEVSKLRDFMGKKTRISTVLKGAIIKVIHEKGGWFELDAGNNRAIAAHFKNYNVNLPAAIQNRVVIVECVAKKHFLADDKQHFAGDTVTYKTDAVSRQKISLEVKGLMVYQ